MNLCYRIALLLLGATLVACSSTLPTPAAPTHFALPDRHRIHTFALNARFALQIDTHDNNPQAIHGRIDWQHHNDNDSLVLLSPFGQEIAEIESHPEGATLHSAQGQREEADTLQELLEKHIGYPIPFEHLPDWLAGRSENHNTTTLDHLGRPSQIQEQGWRIDYEYGNTDPKALPIRLTLEQETPERRIELRLRIETWQIQR